MHQMLTTCPVCSGELAATRLRCTACPTSIKGEFALGQLGRLNREHLRFVELLVKNRGNINQVANDLGVSYTTARTRMDEIVSALGYTPPPDHGTQRRAILQRVESGEISAEEALQLLKR
ncbi:MAG TPA: DUF2089 domain-containing protein [Herpetosiphonaceae bacterium]